MSSEHDLREIKACLRELQESTSEIKENFRGLCTTCAEREKFLIRMGKAIYGNGEDGLLRDVHTLKDRMGLVWKVLFAAIGAGSLTGAGFWSGIIG